MLYVLSYLCVTSQLKHEKNIQWEELTHVSFSSSPAFCLSDSLGRYIKMKYEAVFVGRV